MKRREFRGFADCGVQDRRRVSALVVGFSLTDQDIRIIIASLFDPTCGVRETQLGLAVRSLNRTRSDIIVLVCACEEQLWRLVKCFLMDHSVVLLLHDVLGLSSLRGV